MSTPDVHLKVLEEEPAVPSSTYVNREKMKVRARVRIAGDKDTYTVEYTSRYSPLHGELKLADEFAELCANDTPMKVLRVNGISEPANPDPGRTIGQYLRTNMVTVFVLHLVAGDSTSV